MPTHHEQVNALLSDLRRDREELAWLRMLVKGGILPKDYEPLRKAERVVELSPPVDGYDQ